MYLVDCVHDPAPVHRGRVKPPVSRPPARLAFLQQMEQHELSAIQEVDTPVNISLDTGTPAPLMSSFRVPDLMWPVCALWLAPAELQSADVSESSSASLPAGSSEDGHSASQRSQVTGRISRMSWRETLLRDSTASASKKPHIHCSSGLEPIRTTELYVKCVSSVVRVWPAAWPASLSYRC